MIDRFRRHPESLYGMPKGKYTLELFRENRLLAREDRSNIFPNSLTIQDIFHHKIHFDMNGFMHSKSLMDDNICFDVSLPGMEDWDFVMQIGECYPNNFLYIAKELYHYRRRYGSDGIVGSVDSSYEDNAKKFEMIYKKHKQANLMTGQKWYPRSVNKWMYREKEHRAGRLPSAYLHPFSKYWDKPLKNN